MLQTLMIIYYS